ncbi:NAD-dependent epimerase/dehydratase family protein [Haloarcula onubensis]|uniref:NAD-dependent epimerase/dehydratase family protein n=1 Tax=Haloarcula onubensis TaxID=2950539 RepID=A0ABU2FQP2_9EURY|nr:NAD-dependent epimerase/dehydratase family protein [Halomicroarcula sp. S3CR25-11]MDS0282724.1 NAD-dependent epimerase/dehydratase family protein [Halomicroarcula sp. S3CR25-11]
MNVLIIGGTGLISTAITRQAAAAGHDVTVFTRGEREADLPPSVDRLTGDRTDRESLVRARDSLSLGCVVDMVGFDPTEVETAIEVFAGHVDQYIFCSTVDVYHRPVATMPIRERAAREPPVSDYGADKAACEDRLFEAYRRDGFPATSIRPWHTYGGGGGLIDTLSSDAYVDRLRRGKPIVVHGDGTSVWAPCHRDDVAAAFVAAIGNQEAVGEAYHVTATEPMTWNQYHRRAAAALDAPAPELVHVPTDALREAVPDRVGPLVDHFQFSTVFDTAKAERDLDFRQTVAWEDGVERTVAGLDDDAIADWDSDPEYEAVVSAWRDAVAAFATSVR